ncbi:MAG: hypothetical protein IIA67_13325 [Planctomycetes bacterium]|nr:hypothetical protein [Planctomycetota bacterium]
MTGLAFFSLFMLRSMVRSGGGEAPAPAPNRRDRDRDRDDDDEGEMSEEAVKASKLKRFGESGPSLREELSDLVQEDPDAAAKILRGWIGSGAETTAMTSPITPSSIRKAAVLVVSLRRATADKLLAQMPPRLAERIRDAVATLGHVEPAEQRAVIEEFQEIGPFSPRRSATDAQVDEQPRGGALETSSSPSDSPPVSADGAKPFAFLQSYGSAEIAKLLSGEHPQIIAVVLAHLSPPQAAGVLAQLRPALRSDVVERLVGSSVVDREVVSELDAGLRASLLGGTNRRRLTSAGVDVVRSILDAADRPLADGIIAGIADRDEVLAQRLRGENREVGPSGEPYQRSMAFDDLVELDDADFDTVLQALDADVLALALTGCERGLLDRVLQRLPHAERRRFARALDHLGPTRLSDVEAARRSIAMLAQQLADQERISAPGARRLSVAA